MAAIEQYLAEIGAHRSEIGTMTTEEEQRIAEQIQSEVAPLRRLLEIRARTRIEIAVVALQADGKNGMRKKLRACISDARRNATPKAIKNELQISISRECRALINQLVKSQLHMVAAIARKFWGLPFEDLVAEGNNGLTDAALKFDGRDGNQFNTYAQYWVVQRMIRAIKNKRRTVRIPVHVDQLMGRVSRAQEKLKNQLGREATYKELADYISVSEKDIEKARRLLADDGTVSLDSRQNNKDGDGPERYESFETRGPEIDDTVAVREAMAALTEDKRRVVIEYVLGGRSLKEIGRSMDFSHEWIRNIRNEALAELREALGAALD